MSNDEIMTQEHTVAVVEPSVDGDAVLKYAEQTVERGGRASVIVLLGRETVANIAAFAEAEDLTFPDGREIYLDRLARDYSMRVKGRDRVTIVTDGHGANRLVFDQARRADATSVVVPQRLVNRRKWKVSVSTSPVPVVIAPTKAA